MASFFDDEVAPEVVPLITCINGEYLVDESTLQWLSDKKTSFGIIACAGRYRTGKSFLLNRLANTSSMKGFGVGDSVQACTKGLWIYKRWYSTPDSDKDILYMDTEGIDALDANDTHDVRIFTLALLLCSAFLYNSVGAIDETAMQTLSLMTRVTNNVKVHSHLEHDDTVLAEHMPAFYWMLRDFSLRLVDKSGKALTPDEYLEEALQTSDPQKDAVRGAIRASFKNRSLVTLPRPTADDANISQLEGRLFSVSGKFTSEIDRLRTRLFKEVKPISCNGVYATGNMYAILCRHLVSVIQTDAVPVMRDSWTLMAIAQAKDLKDTCVTELDSRLKEQPPQMKEELELTLAALRVNIMKTFDTNVMQPVDDSIRESLEKMLLIRCNDALPRLLRDLTKEADTILDEIETELLANPQRSAICIKQAKDAFVSKVGKGESVNHTWTGCVGRRTTQWFLDIGFGVDKMQRDVDMWRTKSEALSAELDCAPTVSKVREEELLQTLEDEKSTTAELHARVLRAETEIMVLVKDCQSSDALFSVPRSCPFTDVDTISEDNEQLQALLVEAESAIQFKEGELARERTRLSDMTNKLQQTISTHNTLEVSWTQGLEELRAREQKRSNEMEERYQYAISETKTLTKNLEQEEKKLAACIELHEAEKQQLKTVAQSHREQCEVAQKRVLEIHKNMLDELRGRDERMREVQQEMVKERANSYGQICELQMTLDTTRKRIGEMNEVEREFKRHKTQAQTDQVLIARLKVENEQFRLSQTAFLEEREQLRRENMTMEGELAVLRADKKLNDVRREFFSS